MSAQIPNAYESLSAERKKLQAEGKVPPWYLTPSWQMFRNKYAYPTGYTPWDQFKRISSTLAKHLINIDVDMVKAAEEKFFNLLWKGRLSPSTPVLSNTGTTRGFPVSCQGLTVHDSILGIYDAKREIAAHTQKGFGTSVYAGNIRPRGAKIKSTGDKAEGIVPVLGGLILDSQYVSQGSARRGSTALYTPLEHNDFDELAEFTMANPDDCNVGWNISDDILRKLNEGDFEATRRWKKSMRLKMTTGRGYYWFTDRANRLAPEAIKKSGISIKASNLCFTGGTQVAVVGRDHTNSMKELYDSGEEFLVNSAELLHKDGKKYWNDGVIRRAKVVVTGRREMVKVSLNNGTYFECTPDHAIATSIGTWIEAKDSLGCYPQTTGIPVHVVSVEPIGEFTCYDVQVLDEGLSYDDHNFYLSIPGTYGNKTRVLVHNCTEIALPANDVYTFVCVISSLNLLHWDDIRDSGEDIFWATVFLECVNQEFIRLADGKPGFEKSVRFAKDFGALGLGVCGFHTYLQTKGVPFESLQAHFINNEIFDLIDKETRRASEWMYDKLPNTPKWCIGTGMRHATRMAIAPTKSTALLMGGVSEGINPDPAMTYTQASAGGEMLRVNQLVLKLMRERGAFLKSEFDSLNDHNGSVQHVDWLDSSEKEVFKTAFEINMEAHLRMCSARQRKIDQAQSINLFFGGDEDPRWISHIHRMAFNDEYIKSLYYIYSVRGIKAAPRECIACS